MIHAMICVIVGEHRYLGHHESTAFLIANLKYQNEEPNERDSSKMRVQEFEEFESESMFDWLG